MTGDASGSESGGRPVVMYVINAFDRGGAENGLLALVDGGLFANCTLEIVGLVRGTGGVDAALAERGFPPTVLLDRPRMRVADLPRLFVRLWRHIRGRRPQIVIGSLPQANILARLCVALERRISFVSFEHNTHLAKKAYETAYRLTSWRVNCTFADAASTLEIAIRRLYRSQPAERFVVPLVSFASPARSSSRPGPAGPFRVINAGRLTTVKNQSALIEAVALLVAKNRDVVLTLYGDGSERANYEALARALGIASRVRFAGYVAGWASEPADLFVLTSRHEGLCIVALEAMHAGIPVVVPLVGGLRDYAGPDVAYVLESLDASAVADTIATAMDQGSSTREIADRASRMIDDRFGAAAIRKIYQEINRRLRLVSGSNDNSSNAEASVLGSVGPER